MLSALISLALAAAASAKTLRAATTSPYGQSSLNFEPFNTTYGVALSGRNPVPATIRADLDDAGNLSYLPGSLTLVVSTACPFVVFCVC